MAALNAVGNGPTQFQFLATFVCAEYFRNRVHVLLSLKRGLIVIQDFVGKKGDFFGNIIPEI